MDNTLQDHLNASCCTSSNGGTETITTITNTVVGKKIADYTNESGVISPINESITTVTDVLVNGNTIATHTNENANTVDIKETITVLGQPTFEDNILMIPFTNESGILIEQEVEIPSVLIQRSIFTAIASQTEFTLIKTPIGDVIVTRNGVDISRAFTWVGAVGTYNSTINYNAVIDANDVLQFHYLVY